MSKKGLIYEIVCNETGERYIGSTFEPTVARRIANHRASIGCSSRQIIDRGNYSYGLLETALVDTRDELRMAERKCYDNLDCINKNKPYLSEEEYKEYRKKKYEKHKDQQIENIIENRQEHKEEYNKYMKEYMKNYRLKLRTTNK
jgi:hypothetical protein